MLATTTLELKIPLHAPLVQPAHVQRAFVRHLLQEGQITMPDALALLSADDQTWLIEKLIDDAEKSLLLAATITDAPLRQHYWQQYYDLLGFLFHWHERWSTHHSELLSVLRMAARRYPVQDLTPQRAKVMQRLTARLHDDFICREDVFAAEQALQHVGWNTELDFAPIAEQLIPSYLEELSRA